jgi:hypothetical protein
MTPQGAHVWRVTAMTTFHPIDRKRGRATVRTTWTLCGKAARSCFVFRPTSRQANCEACRPVREKLSTMMPMCTHAGVVSQDECPYCWGESGELRVEGSESAQ